MATFGKTTPSSGWVDITADYDVVSKFTLVGSAQVTKLSIYMDGEGPSGGVSQKLKGVVYSSSGGEPDVLLGTSQEVTVVLHQAAGWVDFAFASPVSLAAGDYWLGYIADVVTNATRYGSDSPLTGNRRYKSRAYALGPLNPYGAPDAGDQFQIDVYATYGEPLAIPVSRHALGAGRW